MSILDDIKFQYRAGGIVNKLIFWNIGCFVLSLVFFWQFRSGYFVFPNWLHLSSDPLTSLTFPWTYITYSFLHSGFLHLLFNLLVLNFAGRLFLTFFTERQLLGVYLQAAVFAGLVFVLSFYLLDYTGNLVGASAAIIGILVATTVFQPMMQLRLLLIGNVRLWHVTTVLLIVDIMQILISNTGGHIAHLAGAAFGFIYIRLLTNGIDLSAWPAKLATLFKAPGKGKKKTPFTAVHRNPAVRPQPRTSKIVTKNRTQQQIDEILDKIGQSGYDSLTAEEKEFLFKAGK